MSEKRDLAVLFEDILKAATTEELEVLSMLLKSTRSVQTKMEPTYLHGAFDYKGELTGQTSYEATIRLNPFFLNILNILHGGITATFADSAMGTLVALLLPADKASVTSELKINYLRPVRGEMLKCKAEIVHGGKNLWVTEAKIYDEEDNTVAFASGSFFVIPRK